MKFPGHRRQDFHTALDLPRLGQLAPERAELRHHQRLLERVARQPLLFCGDGGPLVVAEVHVSAQRGLDGVAIRVRVLGLQRDAPRCCPEGRREAGDRRQRGGERQRPVHIGDSTTCCEARACSQPGSRNREACSTRLDTLGSRGSVPTALRATIIRKTRSVPRDTTRTRLDAPQCVEAAVYR